MTLNIDWKAWTLNELQVVRTTLHEIEGALVEARGRDIKRIRQRGRAGTVSEEDFAIALQEHEGLFEFGIPQILASSLLIYTHTVFETTLSGLATVMQKRLNLRVFESDLNGKGVTRTLAYFNKVLGMNLSTIPGRAVLEEFQSLRNIVAHNESRLGEVERIRSIRSLAARYPGLLKAASWEKGSVVEFKSELVFEFLAAAEGFLGAAYDLVYPPGAE